MKKIISLITCLAAVLGVLAQSPGRVRITFTGFQCNEETWDNAFEIDGKRDEVYIRFDFTHADKNANLKYNYHFTTPVYGDINGYNGRVKAGSGGSTGGLRTGDVFSTSHVIGEYDMAQDDIITLTPAVWEWDNNHVAMQNEMQSQMDKNLQQLHTKALHSVSTMIPGLAGAASFIASSQFFNLPEFSNLITNVLGKEGNRPVGITTDGKFNAAIMVLNTKLMQQVANSNYGYGPGVVPIEYNERMLGNSRDHGAYTLFIKLEFMPAQAAANTSTPSNPSSPSHSVPVDILPAQTTATKAPVPQPVATTPSSPAAQNVITATKPGTTERVPITIPEKNTPTRDPKDRTPMQSDIPGKVNIAIAGKWVGNWGDAGYLTHYYAFILNTDGSIVLYDPNGQETGRGTYELKETNFSATYRLRSNNILYGINGIYDINGNILSGTLQQQLMKNETARWSVKKQ